jgi:uncharacterized protein YndB with AHSA1/START domain
VIEGDAVIHELVLPAPVEQVFDMFTDPQKLVGWIGISANLQPRPGGRFRFEVMPGQFCEGQYIILERPGRLVFTWGWTDPGFGLPPGTSRVEVTLARSGPGGSQTRLRLVHSGLAGDLGILHDDGWSRFLARLTAAAAGAPPLAYLQQHPDERLAILRQQHGRKASSRSVEHGDR